MSWLMLLLACIFEVAWAISMKYSEGFTRPWPTAITLVASVVSFVLLAIAVRTLPLGTCYAVLNGVGIAGTMIFGVALFGESTHPFKILCVVMILVGVVGLRANTNQQPTEGPKPSSTGRPDDADQPSDASSLTRGLSE